MSGKAHKKVRKIVRNDLADDHAHQLSLVLEEIIKLGWRSRIKGAWMLLFPPKKHQNPFSGMKK